MRPSSTGGASSRIRGIFAGTGVLALFLVIALVILKVGSPFAAGRASISSPAVLPTATATPIPLRLTLYDHLTSIDMHSATEGWIVGASGEDGHTFLLHFLRGTWTVDPLQIMPMNPTALKMLSATEGWIAGSDQNGYSGHGIILHIIDGQAQAVTLPDSVGEIQSLAMVSPSEGWAVDDRSFPNGNSQILHYSQGTWNVAFTVPGNAMLESIDMVSPTEGWATGIGETTGALWHYTGGTWQKVPLNDPMHADIEHISMFSPDEGWGIGEFVLPRQPTDQYVRTGGAIWHYSGGTWQVVRRLIEDPSQGQLTQLSALQAVASGEVWLSVSDSTGKRFLHGVNGTWQSVPAAIRDGIVSINMLTPSDGWAVGYAGQIMQCRSGVWIDYPMH